MARPIHFILFVSAFACTVTNRETPIQDSTVVDDVSTTDTANFSADLAVTPNTIETTADTSRLMAVFDEQLTNATNDQSRYYIVTITVSQYEGSSDITWYFDKALAPRYFKETWSMEGNEGNNELMIENGSVVCASSDDNHAGDKWCVQTGGIRRTRDESETVELLAADYGTISTKQFEDELATLVRILKDGTITSESPDSYSVRIESTVDVGQEVTESTQVDIPKAVYDELMR